MLHEDLTKKIINVSTLRPEHEWQLLNYLKATDLKVGLLLNFGQSAEIRRKILTSRTV